MSILVKCSCGKQYRVKDSLAGKRARCSSCQQELVVPIPSTEPAKAGKPEVVEAEAVEPIPDPASLPDPADRDIDPNSCFTCRRGRAGSSNMEVALQKLGLGPFDFMCIDCGNNWTQPAKTNRQHFAKAETAVGSFVPQCPNCSSGNTAAVGLLSLPAGPFFFDFQSHGVIEYGDGTLKEVAEGTVVVPRCDRCKRVNALRWLTIFGITFVGYVFSVWRLSLWISGFRHEDWRDPVHVYAFAAVLGVVPGFVVACIAILISLGIFGADKSDEFPPLKRLRRKGWKTG